MWSGGLRSAPVASSAGLATDPQGRIWVDPNLRSISHSHIIAVGDAAHPVAPTGAPYRLSAFVAIASGAYAADVILAQRAKRPARAVQLFHLRPGCRDRPRRRRISELSRRQTALVHPHRQNRAHGSEFLRVVHHATRSNSSVECRVSVLAGTAASVMAAGKRSDTTDPDRAKGPDGLTLDRAFAELRPAMFALAYRITGNRADADEIVQDAFVRLHDASPKDAVRSLKAYLATITARLSLNRLRDQPCAPRNLYRRVAAGTAADGG